MSQATPVDAAYRREGDDLLLTLRVQPRASRTEWCGMFGNAIRLRLAAPPVDGKANAELVKWLAREFAVAKSAVHIEAGSAGRNKRIRICAPGRLPAFFGKA